MGQEDRLRALEVRVAGEVSVVVALVGAADQHVLERRGCEPTTSLRLPPDPEAQVERDLVVATAPGVELGARRTRDLRHPAFDRGVDVLVRRHELERAAVQLRADLIERVGDGEALRLGEEPHRGQHVDVRARPDEVIVGEPLVEGQADAQRHQRLGRALPEPTVPERLGVAASS